MVARPIVMLVLAGIDRPRAMTRTPSAAVRNAMTQRSVRYRNRWETRNGGGAGGAETIRAAPTHPRVQRDFAPSSAFHGRPRSLVIGTVTRAKKRRAETSPRCRNQR